MVDGLHEAIVSEDVWNVAQEIIERYADLGCVAIRASSIEKMEQDIVIFSIMVDKVTGDNIYKALIYFDDFYDKMDESERREFMTVLLDNIQVYEER